MRPERTETINGFLIEEFWWGGELVVYVDHRSTLGKFEIICAIIRGTKTTAPGARTPEAITRKEEHQ
ncbi:MAG: hypothetical protein PHC49_10745 [Desulfuromonadaceae bacterium]|nr:hypothetical protein [Desulfuromonadaceae bacterium]